MPTTTTIMPTDTTTPIVDCLMCDATTDDVSGVCDACHDHPDDTAALLTEIAQPSPYGERATKWRAA